MLEEIVATSKLGEKEGINFTKFAKGTSAITTEGERVMVLSDKFFPETQVGQEVAEKIFGPEQIPFSVRSSQAGEEKLVARIYRTRHPQIFYTEHDLVNKDGQVVSGTRGYFRPWNVERYLEDHVEK